MTLREWTVTYTLRFGREQLNHPSTMEELEFINMMIADLSKQGFGWNVYVAMAEELRRIDHEHL